MSKVLVYAGPGTSHGSRVATCTTLTRLFRHQYDVQEVDAATLARDPWEDVTKLVVLPGGRDMPYVAELERTFPRAGDGTPADPCLLYTSPSPRDATLSRMPSSA